MNTDPLCRQVAESIIEADGDSHRCFIRFADRKRCCDFVQLLALYMKERLLSRIIEPSSNPCLIRCRMRQAARWMRYDLPFNVAYDHLVHLDTRCFLPQANHASLSFDPKQRIPWGISAVRASQLWRRTQGRHVRIGIVDTGVDYHHPDIRHALRPGVNILNARQSAADDNGHGTHIAGTIAACGGSRGTRGIRGAAPKALLYPVKAFDHEGSAYVSDIILAIEWCIHNKMDIINMSFGMSEFSPAMLQAVKTAHQSGIIVVASSGNAGKTDSVDYPARLPYTIGVGAVNKQGRIAAFSNRGPEVDIYGPGEAIYSTWPGRRYNELSGTSMAAAHISGVLALLISGKPKASRTAVKQAILSSAVPLAGYAAKSRSLPGRIHALRAWCSLQRRAVVRRKPAQRKAAFPIRKAHK